MNLVVKGGSWKRGRMDRDREGEKGRCCSFFPPLLCISLFIPLLDANFPVLLNYSNCRLHKASVCLYAAATVLLW